MRTDEDLNSENESNSSDNNFTDFGYTKVSEHEKEEKVAEVFDSVADNYDLMNDLMSFGLHRIWKRQAVGICNIREGDRVLDLAGGTGDITKLIHKKIGKAGEITLSDINPNMLEVGKNKLLDLGIIKNINYVVANAEKLPFKDNTFNKVIIGFGLRNVTKKDKALSEIYRVLKPGGKIIVLEFSKPNSKLSAAYDFYSFKVIPKIGKLIANDEDSYKYLAESIRMHPNQEKLLSMIENEGFALCKYKNLLSGIVAIHTGIKP